MTTGAPLTTEAIPKKWASATRSRVPYAAIWGSVWLATSRRSARTSSAVLPATGANIETSLPWAFAVSTTNLTSPARTGGWITVKPWSVPCTKHRATSSSGSRTAGGYCRRRGWPV